MGERGVGDQTWTANRLVILQRLDDITRRLDRLGQLFERMSSDFSYLKGKLAILSLLAGGAGALVVKLIIRLFDR